MVWSRGRVGVRLRCLFFQFGCVSLLLARLAVSDVDCAAPFRRFCLWGVFFGLLLLTRLRRADRYTRCVGSFPGTCFLFGIFLLPMGNGALGGGSSKRLRACLVRCFLRGFFAGLFGARCLIRNSLPNNAMIRAPRAPDGGCLSQVRDIECSVGYGSLLPVYCGRLP